MLSKHNSILRKINNASGKYNIGTFPTHERAGTGFRDLPHTFYLFSGENIKPWVHEHGEMPANHIMMEELERMPPDISLDMMFSQNKFGQFEKSLPISKAYGIPLVSLEHTLPHPSTPKFHLQKMKEMSGDLNVFISEFSVKQWEFSLDDPSVRVVHHGIDTDFFCPPEHKTFDDKVLTVANLYVERDWCLNFGMYKRICIDNSLPINPVGNTPGLSEAAKDIFDLRDRYQKATVFLNTSSVSPIPMSLLEAMSHGLPCVSSATCMIPTIIEDGINGFCSNDEDYLLKKLKWCLNNKEEAYDTIGKKARETIVNRFNMKRFQDDWRKIFNEAYSMRF